MNLVVSMDVGAGWRTSATATEWAPPVEESRGTTGPPADLARSLALAGPVIPLGALRQFAFADPQRDEKFLKVIVVFCVLFFLFQPLFFSGGLLACLGITCAAVL